MVTCIDKVKNGLAKFKSIPAQEEATIAQRAKIME